MPGDESDSVDREAAAWMAELPGVDAQVETARMRLLRLGRQMDRMLAQIARRHGLTLGDWETLSTLRRSGPPYSLSPSALGHRLQLTAGTVSVRIDRLRRTGLIEAQPSGSDRDARMRPVRLTHTGHARWRAATAERIALEHDLLGRALGQPGVRRLNTMLRRLMVAFESQLGPPPPRPDDSR